MAELSRRKPSAKRESRLVRELRRELQERRLIGALMANICFNTSQPTWTVNERDRKNMEECQKEWDAIKKAGKP